MTDTDIIQGQMSETVPVKTMEKKEDGMGNHGQRSKWIQMVMILAMVLVMACFTGCASKTPEDDMSSSSKELLARYVGRDCMFYHGQLYWNNGVWFSTTEGENYLPEEAYEAGKIVRMVNAMPQSEGEAARLPEGTQYLYHEQTDAIFVKQEDGYIQYIPMPGMKEAVEKWQGIEPTGLEPGYDYNGMPLIFYEEELYAPSFTLYTLEQVGKLTQLGRIQCRYDGIPSEHLHSAILDAGTILYRCANYPDHLVIYQSLQETYQLYQVKGSAE